MSSYDFVYLPIDFGNKCNVGYGFVNMTTPEAVWRLYKAFHNNHWKLFQSNKICEVTYARVQGLESLKEHFKHLKLPKVEMEYKPVIFSPARDGRLLTKPIAIVVDPGARPVEDSCPSRDETVTSCSQKLLLNMLDAHCNDCNEEIVSEGNQMPMSSYDFVYLPIDFGNKCNVGYGFVNMTTPEAVWRLYKAFHNNHWRLFQSNKICEVTYARVQGLESLKEHFKHLKLAKVEMEYKPVIFSPARDGRLLTEPIAIVVDPGTRPVEDSCPSRDETVTSCSSSIERSDG
ncbi:hypothetical protein DY000_02063248 [Brassica cretica]|uniref:Mei2-like C-terminal RNA recognition motif domain-containing protein n=1 Tax=Brassica cretica TaxID=69181 RepID=A0ABQ7AYU0_BRACR|nr:hypothetical protein DY000_02063248 [Brassica cretica]